MTQFNEGDKVKVGDDPFFRTAKGSHNHSTGHRLVGREGVVSEGPDPWGDFRVVFDGGMYDADWIAPDCLSLVEPEPEPEPTFNEGDRGRISDQLEPVVRYEVGSRVVVTGDTATWGHGFTAGDEGTVSLVNEEDRDYLVDGDDGDEIWYVHHDDLELVKEAGDKADPLDVDLEDWDSDLYDMEHELLSEAYWDELEDDEPDMVKQPQHYLRHPSGLEVIDITRHHNFAIGNAIKYILRHEHKGKPVEDLRKAIQYLEFEIEDIEAGRREVAA